MKLSETQRNFAFLKAKSIDPNLGDLFQNEMIFKAEDITAEMDRLHEIETKMKNMIKGYRSDLTSILAAMGQGKETLS